VWDFKNKEMQAELEAFQQMLSEVGGKTKIWMAAHIKVELVLFFHGFSLPHSSPLPSLRRKRLRKNYKLSHIPLRGRMLLSLISQEDGTPATVFSTFILLRFAPPPFRYC